MASKKLYAFPRQANIDANNDLFIFGEYISGNSYEVKNALLSEISQSIDYNNLSNLPVLFSGSYNDLSNLPTLGTAAALDAGTSANQVVQLNVSSQLPAIDGSLLTNIQMTVPYQTFQAKTADYTIQQSDHGTWINCSTNNVVITLPNGLSSGTQVIVDRRGTQTVTVTASTTLLGKNVSANSVAIANQWGVVHCVHTGSNIWRITGDL